VQDREYLIYCHTSPSGKKYIGQTKNYNRRCTQHRNSNERGFLFKSAIQKYGWDSFTHEILKDSLTVDEANELEKYFIKKYNTLAPNGYNLRTGGENSVYTEEYKLRMKDSYKNRKHGGSKLFTVITPTGEIVELFGKLNAYCKENSLDYRHMRSVASGYTKQHKGYRCIKGKVDGNIDTISNKTYILQYEPPTKERGFAKRYEVIDPSGSKIILKGTLKQYCKDNSLSYDLMLRVSNKNYKATSSRGYSCKEISMHITEEIQPACEMTIVKVGV
jgi:group I intron endonuclease